MTEQGLGKIAKKKINTKSYKEQEVGESHNCLYPEGEQHIEKVC